MRFFKYLVLISLFLISHQIYAASCTAYGFSYQGTGGSSTEACANLYKAQHNGDSPPTTFKVVETGSGNFACSAFSGNSFGSGSCTQPKCPTVGTPADFHKGSNGQIPTKRCMNINGSICSFSAQGKQPFWVTLSGGQTPTRQLYSDSENPSPSCQNLDDGQCDSSNPYGDCYQRPNDGCVRNSDGSINCPQNQPPPINQGCENGAAYCDRPPQGCGPDYVSGSFNGRQICVRKGPDSPTDPNQPITPNDPTEPNNPNKCTGSYCPKPDNDKDCPTGYYKTQFQGKSICVKDNSNPNQQNPNDPNNSANPPQPNDPNNPNPPFDSSGIINAIKSLRDSLLGSIDGVSRKLTTLIDGQKTSNEHLKNIKDESVKSNESLKKIDDSTRAASEALGTANDHLDKIEEATLATSEATGQTNKKLDSLNDSINSQTKCINENYNSSDPQSNKYKTCTKEQLDQLSGNSNATVPTGQLDERSFLTNLITVNSSYCPADKQLNMPTPFGHISKSISFADLCEQSSWFGYIVLALSYLFAAYIVVRA